MRIEPAFLFDLDGTLSTASTSMCLLEGGARYGGHRPLGVAHPSQDRYERRVVHQPALARRPGSKSARTASNASNVHMQRPIGGMATRSVLYPVRASSLPR
jgi:hypothetical protein